MTEVLREKEITIIKINKMIKVIILFLCILMFASCAKKTVPNESTVWIVEPTTYETCKTYEHALVREFKIKMSGESITTSTVLIDMITGNSMRVFFDAELGVVAQTRDDLNGDMLWFGLFYANTPYEYLLGENTETTLIHCLTDKGKMFYTLYDDVFMQRMAIQAVLFMNIEQKRFDAYFMPNRYELLRSRD